MVLKEFNGAVFMNTTPLYNHFVVDDELSVVSRLPEYDGVLFLNTTTTAADGGDVLVVVDELLALTCLPKMNGHVDMFQAI